MFQRLKGAIDSRIAEEQARQRSALTSPPPSNVRKSSSRAESPAKRTVRQNASNRQSGEASAKGPDPSEFEPEFVIEDSDVPSRSNTPRPAMATSETSTQESPRETTGEARDGKDKAEKAPSDAPDATPQDLPTDVRVKLRKLDKLESRYNDLLRSYRLAHARVQTIDTFEASLRENTPLTSINDPRALVEYLNQLNLKSDLVVDELKRVSHERDTYKQQVDDAEQRAREAWDEVTNLRAVKDTGDPKETQSEHEGAASPVHSSPVEQTKVEQSPSVSAKSPPSPAKSHTGSLPSLSIFSPKPKPTESPLIKELKEDLFSYDDEIPRLQLEVKERDTKIEGLQGEVTSLRGDLAVTRESTQSMVQSLEEATRELNSLRDHKERSIVEIEEHRQASKKLSDKLEADLRDAEAKSEEAEAAAKSKDGTRLSELEQQLDQANDELKNLREGAENTSNQVHEVQALQEKLATLEMEISEVRTAKEQSEKKVDTLNSLMKNVREQLAEKERQHVELMKRKEESDEELRERIRQLEHSLETQQTSQRAASESATTITNSASTSQTKGETPERDADTATSGKKKNKKKKKGGASMGEQAKEPRPGQSESSTTNVSGANHSVLATTERVNLLQDELKQLRQQLEEKNAALDKMRSRLKDQDDLKEEIESLRDDLINVGQEHVGAKDKIKELQAEKKALQDTVSALEKEFADLQGLQTSTNASSAQKHQDLTAQFEDLTTKAATLQTDLSAAQQLASTRFKELGELKTVMQKAQPELTSLRREVSELGTIKGAHDEKVKEINMIESRQEELRAELTTQKRVVAERDAEIRNMRQKLSQESNSRSLAEDRQNKANQEVQRLETEKRQATESLDKLSRDLSRTREEMTNSKNMLRDLEQQIGRLKRDNEGLKEEIELKTAQHASAQSLMSSMRDQTAEMALQLKEAQDRCGSLDEEVADAHRLLSERSREGETMRRLLAEVEGKADARTREMKERMEIAIEERDRAEDEASTAARRRARELDDLRNNVREAERSLKRAEEDKEELETAQRDWKRRREELEQRSEKTGQEAEEVRRAMGELRDALDESERQAREVEKQKAELRKSVEETQQRLEKLQRTNKTMADEIRTMQTGKHRGMDSEAQSSRSSTDSVPTRARVKSPGRASQANGPSISPGARPGLASEAAVSSMDFVYLKNVLLQFLEQKDRNHQKQLIPVLGMLLHFDRGWSTDHAPITPFVNGEGRSEDEISADYSMAIGEGGEADNERSADKLTKINSMPAKLPTPPCLKHDDGCTESPLKQGPLLDMSSLPFRQPSRQPSRQMSTDPHNELNPQMNNYIGIDVGTGSARACVINAKGDILGMASENIGLWQPDQGYYVTSVPSSEQSTNDIWRCICNSVQRILNQQSIDPTSIRGLAFDATCSLAVFSHDTDEPVSVTGPNFDNDHNIILWLDHRPVDETAKINATKHNLLRYVGGTMSIEMEIPKVLWLKNNMPKELFDRCKFYDLADALTHMATGNETRSYCSTVCKQGFVPVGVDGSVKGWQEDFLKDIGLADLTEDNFKRLGGVDGVNGKYTSAGEKVGTLSDKAAGDLGLPAGIAVGSGVIDAYAGWVGTVGAKVDLSSHELSSDYSKTDKHQAFTRLAAVAGTSTCHIAMSPEPVFVKGVWGPYRDVLIPDYWMAEGGQSATGELLKHVLETHPAFQQTLSLSESYNTNIYDYLNEHLKDMQKKQSAPSISYLGRHFFFYGDLFGNRSPVADPRMTGSVIGLSSDKTIDGLALYYYATMEFIALQTHQIIETMNKSGHQIHSIFMSGSQCQNDILMRLMASACDMPVLIPQYVHAAVVHGAAMLGAKAASADKDGKTEPLWDIMDRMSKPGKTVPPTSDPHEKELLAVKYKVFLEQCNSQQVYRKDVDDVIEKWNAPKNQDENWDKAVHESKKEGGGINMSLPLG
ncbi:MAG: hypothetical protein Q9186_007546 [Xanthomendoza sp. 1 TL-2023]